MLIASLTRKLHKFFRLNNNNSNTFFLILNIVFVTGSFILILKGYLYRLVFVTYFGSLIMLAIFFPMLIIVALFITGILPFIFHMTDIFQYDFAAIGAGFNAVDAALLAMGVAIVLELAVFKRKNYKNNSTGLAAIIILFGLWLLFEIVRNVGVYKLSAPGEFRYRYMILLLPLYVALFFPSREKRFGLFKMLAFISVIFTLACIPIIGWIKGWTVGTGSRFLPACISLGMVYGLTAIFLARKYRIIRLKNLLLWIITVPAVILILIDTHRSAWAAAAVILLVLIFLKQVKLKKLFSWVVPLMLSLVLVYALFRPNTPGFSGVVDNIKVRSKGIVQPQRDYTASWRMATWKATFKKFLKTPILGEGFGGYWHVYVPELRTVVTVSPHNLYLQTLVKTGLIGLLIYLIIIGKLIFLLGKWAVDPKNKHNPEMAIVATGIAVLLGAHIFYTVYAFEYYTWLFVGLGIAVIRDKSSHEK